MDYCLPSGYRARHDRGRSVDDGFEGDSKRHPDAYTDAAALARRLGSRGIVGIGCGTAEKLVALHPEFGVVGIDDSANIRHCRERYDFGTWLASDLDSNEDLDPAHLRDSVVVCENVIERVPAPEKLLTLLAGTLAKGAHAVVLSTPHRELTNAPGHLGPPENRAHVREWTGDELERFMATLGLTGHFGLTRSSEVAPFLRAVFVVIPGGGAEHHEMTRQWWAERESWQRLVEEQDRTILRQQASIAELRTERDWFAQHREAWETTAREQERQLIDRDERIAELDAALASALGPGDGFERRSSSWVLRLALTVANVVRRFIPRRS
jgi:SAM-dependent methyltransferase